MVKQRAVVLKFAIIVLLFLLLKDVVIVKFAIKLVKSLSSGLRLGSRLIFMESGMLSPKWTQCLLDLLIHSPTHSPRPSDCPVRLHVPIRRYARGSEPLAA